MNRSALTRLRAALLWLWLFVSFATMWFARELSALQWMGWPLHYWIGAQGAVVVFLAILLIDIGASRVMEPEDAVPDTEGVDAAGIDMTRPRVPSAEAPR